MKKKQEKSNEIHLDEQEILFIVNTLSRIYFLDPDIRRVLRLLVSKVKLDD